MKRYLRIIKIWYSGKLPYAQRVKIWIRGTLFRQLNESAPYHIKKMQEKYGNIND